MALAHSPTIDLGATAPGFSLPDPDGRIWSLDDIRGAKGTVIAFICNHCPYVLAVIDRLVDDARKLEAEEIGFAAINPNDWQRYPADSPEKMRVFAAQHKLPFPYLIDESQDVARAYGAVCTPDVFGFDGDLVLKYRGRIDSAGKNPAGPDTRRELLEAMRSIAADGNGPDEQIPSMGCSIKWRDS
jgi:peroxiredoxin